MTSSPLEPVVVRLAEVEADVPVKEYVAWVEVVTQTRVPLMDDTLLRALRIAKGLSRRTIATLFGLEPKELALFLEPLLTKQLVEDTSTGEVQLGPAGLELFRSDEDEEGPSQVQTEMRELRFRIDQISLASLNPGSLDSYRPIPMAPERNFDRSELEAAARKELREDRSLLTGKRLEPEVAYEKLSKDKERLHRIVDLTEGRDRTWRLPVSVSLDAAARAVIVQTRAFRQQGDVERRAALLAALADQAVEKTADSDGGAPNALLRIGEGVLPNLLDMTHRKGLESLTQAMQESPSDSFSFLGYPEASCPEHLRESLKRANQMRNLLQGTELPLICIAAKSRHWARGGRYEQLRRLATGLTSTAAGLRRVVVLNDSPEAFDLRRGTPLEALELGEEGDLVIAGPQLLHSSIEVMLIPDLWVRVVASVRGFLAEPQRSVSIPIGFCSTDKDVCSRVTRLLGDAVRKEFLSGNIQVWGMADAQAAAVKLYSALAGEGRKIKIPKKDSDATVTKL